MAIKKSSYIGRFSIFKVSILSNLIYRFNEIPIKSNLNFWGDECIFSVYVHVCEGIYISVVFKCFLNQDPYVLLKIDASKCLGLCILSTLRTFMYKLSKKNKPLCININDILLKIPKVKKKTVRRVTFYI